MCMAVFCVWLSSKRIPIDPFPSLGFLPRPTVLRYCRYAKGCVDEERFVQGVACCGRCHSPSLGLALLMIETGMEICLLLVPTMTSNIASDPKPALVCCDKLAGQMES